MSTVVTLQKDPFRAKLKGKVGRIKRLSKKGSPRDFSHVRRPFRGISIKEDTWATLEVVDDDGTPIPLLDSGSRLSSDQIAVIEDALGFRPKVKRGEDLTFESDEDLPTGYASPNDRNLLRDGNAAPGDSDAISATRADFVGGADTALSRTTRDVQATKSTIAASTKLSSLQKTARDPDTVDRLKKFASGGYSLRYSNFILTSAQEPRAEKYQIMETFWPPFLVYVWRTSAYIPVLWDAGKQFGLSMACRVVGQL